MSFASEVKKELLGIKDISIQEERAVILGILQSCSELVISKEGTKIILKSYILLAIQKTMQCIKSIYKHMANEIMTEIEYGTDQNINKKRYYYLHIRGNISQLIEDFSLMPFDTIDQNHPFLENDSCKAAFIRGLFIAKGSINDPRKNNYHFEITCRSQDIANLIKEILLQNEIETKVIEKKDAYVAYVKKSESISSCLAYIGASSGVFYFEDSRIVRDISNMANRMANCDIANVKKSAETANKQLHAIHYIRKMGYFNKMPVRLQTMAMMREEYPSSSLEELSEFSDNYFGKPLSKSGISHCLRSLIQYYEEIHSKNQR